MNREQFNNYLQHPDQLTSSADHSLKELIEKYPYCQSLHLLFIKSLHNQDSVHYYSQLKLSAAYAINRKQLYNLVNDKPENEMQLLDEPVQASSLNIIEESINQPVDEINNTSNKNLELDEVSQIENEVNENEVQISKHVEDEIELKQPSTNEELIENSEIENTETIVEFTPENQELINNIADIDEQKGENLQVFDLSSENGNREIENKSQNFNLTNDVELEISELEIKKDASISNELEITNNDSEEKLENDQYNKTELEELTEETVITLEKEQNNEPIFVLDPDAKFTFLEWFNQLKKKEQRIIEKLETEEEIQSKRKEEQALDKLYRENLFHLSAADVLLGDEKPTVVFNFSKNEDVVLEKFIREEPHLKQADESKVSSENKAQKSSEDQELPVTETLAIIYEQQRLYEKAIGTYQKLSLKFPEKSLYFDILVKKIEEKIK